MPGSRPAPRLPSSASRGCGTPNPGPARGSRAAGGWRRAGWQFILVIEAAVTRDLIGARARRARALGADRLWMRCVQGSASHRLALSHGWSWWARTEFEGAAASQQAILLAPWLGDAS